MRAGVVYLSGDRQRDGIFGVLSVAENLAVSRRVVSQASRLIIDWGAERVRAVDMVSKLAVKTARVETPLRALSGGNQQKVLLGRFLELSPRVLLLDNVTRGVDVGAKDSIYEVLRSLARDGASIVLSGDDLDELISISDRILVFKGGAMVREFSNPRRDIESLELLAAMV